MSSKIARLTFVLILIFLPASLWSQTHDWPQWRGPDQSLSSSGNGVFEGPELGLEIAWKRPLGAGYSSISVVGERAVTMYSDGDKDLLVALDAATGAELWRYEIGPTYEGHSGSDDGPLSTPTVAGGRVFALGPKGQLFAVGLEDGKEIWRQQIEEQYQAVAPHYGYTTVPVMVDGNLIVQTGGPGGRSITALDPATGERRWSAGSDTVGYHSPLVVELGGERQVLAISSRHLLGLDPGSGEELWRYQYSEEDDLDAQPVAVGGGRVLLAHQDAAAMVRVARSDGADGGYAVEELWRKETLRNTSVVPIYHDGHLYGYSGRFLTCVGAETGEMVWKSRPPGYGGMVLIDGHLVHFADHGNVVISEANPEGYVEKARLEVSDSDNLTPPSFAGGRFFVRNLTDVAALNVTDRATTPPAPLVEEAALYGELGELVRGLGDVADKRAVLGEWMAKQDGFPAVEGDSLVHFVYRGDVDDIAVSGNFLDMGAQEPLHHVAGTDFYFRSYELTPKAHFEYRFHVFDEALRDPLNPRFVEPEDRGPSALAMPGWEEPAHLRGPEAERGRIETFTWKSEALENEREMQVYLPAGYDAGEERYPLAIVNYGEQALAEGRMANTLDNLIGKSVRPVIVAFLPRVDFDEYSTRVDAFTTAVTTELLPYLDEHYRTLPGAENRAMAGIASGAFGSAYVALKSGAVGKVATQSFYMRDTADALRAMIAADDRKAVEFYVEWSVNDLKSAGDAGIQCRRDSTELAELLEGAGYPVVANEVGDGGGWGSWRSRNDVIFETFFPLD